jgi:hypothetical protein
LSDAKAKNTVGTKYVCRCADEKAGSKDNAATLQPPQYVSKPFIVQTLKKNQTLWQ